MTLLRASSRTMLASYFVTSGYKAVRHPELLVAAAEPVADRLVPVVKKYAPAEIAGFVPEDTKTLVRINGAAQVLGGLALATGKGRRVGAVVLAASLIPSTLAKHPFWTRTDAEEKAQDRSHFFKNLSLLGGVLLAANDTEGRPSLVWRAQKGTELLARDTRKTAKRIGRTTGLATGVLAKNASDIAETVGDIAGSVGKNASGLAGSVSKGTSQLTDGAFASGAALVGAAVSTSRAAKKRATKQLKARQVAAAKQFKEAQEAAKKQAKVNQRLNAKQAKVDARQDVKQAKVDARQDAKQAKVDARQDAKQAKVAERVELAQAKVAEKQHLKEAAKAEKRAAKAQRNIQRGEN